MPELTVIQEDKVVLVVQTPPQIQILDIVQEESPILEIITEGPMGPPDTRPRPSDISFSVLGEFEENEMLLRLELGAEVLLVPSRCRASAETYPTSPATIRITLETGGINKSVANVVFTESNTAIITLSNNLVLEPGIIRVLSSDASFGLKDFSITLSGDR